MSAELNTRQGRSSAETWVWLLAGGVHLLFWVSLRTYWLCPLFNDTVHRFGPGADFFAVYQAGYSALHGDSIYRFGEVVVPYAYPFRYLPISAYTIGVLYNLVPPPTAYALWLGVCEWCLLVNVRATYVRAGKGRRGALLAAVWLAFFPFFAELWVGQFTFMLGTLLFWSVLAMLAGKGHEAQRWWGAAVLWKPAALLWLPLWLRERRYWRGVAVLLGSLGLNLCYFSLFPGDWRFFAAENLGSIPTWHAGNVGLSGLIYHFTGPGPGFLTLRYALTALLVLPALWVTWRPPAEAQPPFWLVAGLWTLLYFLIYKDVWEHHLTLLLPFLVLALWQSPTRLLVVVTILLALPSPFIFYDVPGLGFNQDPQPHFSPAASLVHHAWRVIPLVALYHHWLGQCLQWKLAPHSDPAGREVSPAPSGRC